MSLSYGLNSLCAAPYEGGRISFTADGSTLAVPCGNRVTVYDLQVNKVNVLPFEAHRNIRHLLFMPKEPILLTIDESGRCLIVNFVKGVVLARVNFKAPLAMRSFPHAGATLQ